MKIGILIARILLGLMFVVGGLNHIVPFIPMKEMPSGDVGAMMMLMLNHKWFVFYGAVEAAAGLMLVFGRFVPLGLTLLAALIVNILLFDVTLMPAGTGMAVVLGALELFLVYAYRDSFAGIFSANAKPV
jgi:putative oxidoreductase